VLARVDEFRPRGAVGRSQKCGWNGYWPRPRRDVRRAAVSRVTWRLTILLPRVAAAKEMGEGVGYLSRGGPGIVKTGARLLFTAPETESYRACLVLTLQPG